MSSGGIRTQPMIEAHTALYRSLGRGHALDWQVIKHCRWNKPGAQGQACDPVKVKGQAVWSISIENKWIYTDILDIMFVITVPCHTNTFSGSIPAHYCIWIVHTEQPDDVVVWIMNPTTILWTHIGWKAKHFFTFLCVYFLRFELHFMGQIKHAI